MNQEQRMKVLNHPGLTISEMAYGEGWEIEICISQEHWTPKHERVFGKVTDNIGYSKKSYHNFNIYYNAYVIELARHSIRSRRAAIEIAYAFLIKPFEERKNMIPTRKDQFVSVEPWELQSISK